MSINVIQSYRLPIELINKILIMRPTHDVAKLIKKSAIEYNIIYRNANSVYDEEDDNFNYVSFYKYLKGGGETTENKDSYLFWLYKSLDIIVYPDFTKLKNKNL